MISCCYRGYLYARGLCTHSETSLSSSACETLRSRSSSWSGEARSSSNTSSTLNSNHNRQRHSNVTNSDFITSCPTCMGVLVSLCTLTIINTQLIIGNLILINCNRKHEIGILITVTWYVFSGWYYLINVLFMQRSLGLMVITPV